MSITGELICSDSSLTGSLCVFCQCPGVVYHKCLLMKLLTSSLLHVLIKIKRLCDPGEEEEDYFTKGGFDSLHHLFILIDINNVHPNQTDQEVEAGSGSDVASGMQDLRT